MFVVVFTAVINELDAEYSAMAARMRDLAINEYGCTEFIACTEGDKEIAISYWPSREHIKVWHENSQHRTAQALGKEKWYKSYQVSVAELVR